MPEDSSFVSSWRSSMIESETDESHSLGTMLLLLLDGSADAEELAADESRQLSVDLTDKFDELCDNVGVETGGSNSGLEVIVMCSIYYTLT